jgi:hypothetical protein
VKHLPDLTNQKGRRGKRKKVRSSQKKVAKLSSSGLATVKCRSKKISPREEKALEPVTTVTRQKTSSAPDTGPVRHGEDWMTVKEVLAKLERHEAECNLRYQRIEERLDEHKSTLKSLDVKLWALAVLILIAPFVQKFLG